MVIYNGTLCTESIKTSCRHGNKYHSFSKSGKRMKYDLEIIFEMLQKVINLAKKGL